MKDNVLTTYIHVYTYASDIQLL